MLSEGFASFAEKYFKDGALLQHVNLDFADTQLREDEELEEIDLVFDFLQEYHCTQVQSFRIMSRYHTAPSTLLMIAVHCPKLANLQLVSPEDHEDTFGDTIITLPAILQRLPYFKSLTLNMMGADHIQRYSSEDPLQNITQHIHLQELVLQKVTSTTFSSVVLHVIPHLPNLRQLKIGCHDIRNVYCDDILHHCHQLDSITITGDQFLEYKPFAYNHKLPPGTKSLHLRADPDDWEQESVEQLLYIEKHHRELDTLVLENSVFVNPTSIRKLSSLSSFPNLRCLVLAGYCLDNYGSADIGVHQKELVQFLSGCPNLEQIRFDDMEGLVNDDILDTLQMNSLRSLHLAQISTITTNAIASFIQRHPQLQEIVIHDMEHVDYSLLPIIGITCHMLKWLDFYPDSSGHQKPSEYQLIDEFFSTHCIHVKMDEPATFVHDARS